MLVKITNNCDMNCTHCMENAGPSEEYMSMDVYKQVLKFIAWTKFPMIMFSGGEPTNHPEILTMIKMAIHEKNLQPFLLSNGTFLEKPELKDAILNSHAKIQITNDQRFYPREVPVIEHSSLSYEHHIRIIAPFGRAITNKIPITQVSPACFNMRSLCRGMGSFKVALFNHRLDQKMCTPSINIDGSIAAGETNSCSVIGTVYDDDEKLTENLYSLKCSKCGLVHNLDKALKRAIGEE